MRRPQFSLKTLLWLMAVVAALLGGMALQRQFDKPFTVVETERRGSLQKMTLEDGSIWVRLTYCVQTEDAPR